MGGRWRGGGGCIRKRRLDRRRRRRRRRGGSEVRLDRHFRDRGLVRKNITRSIILWGVRGYVKEGELGIGRLRDEGIRKVSGLDVYDI